jgi:chorismate mutase
VAGDLEEDTMGSAALCDNSVLQSLIRRIHCGKFVAEAKFQSERRWYEGLIRRRDVHGIERAITDEELRRRSWNDWR